MLRGRKESLVVDLLNNASRRAEEGKYDDAVARLYRCIELIAQIKLKERFGIDTSDVDLKLIPEEVKDELERKRDEKGRIKIGLSDSYKLLSAFNDELGGNSSLIISLGIFSQEGTRRSQLMVANL